MYCRPGFKRNLRHWSERKRFNNILTDIYDGQIWKNFKETSAEKSSKFFWPEVADSNLGLMLNLDWFQPYDDVIHSTGVIYAAICNLPRDMRFKCENMLVLGLLPSPTLQKIENPEFVRKILLYKFCTILWLKMYQIMKYSVPVQFLDYTEFVQNLYRLYTEFVLKKY
jgi:hypothetical protein